MRAQRFVDTLTQRICEGVATARSLGVYLRIKYECWDELAVMAISPCDYADADSYYADRVCVDLLRKDASLPTSFDREAEAVRIWWASERSCYRTNERLAPYLVGVSHPHHEEAIGRFVRLCRKHVRLLLGSAPPAEAGRFGPGSTYGDRGQLTTLPDKMQSQPTVNLGGTLWLQSWSVNAWGKACASRSRDESLVRGSRFTTVPKDCRKDRGIAIEPSINVFYQLAMGRGMRRRLAFRGINLDHAQDIHKQVACEASIRGHFSTIDLSNASDTVCSNLVELLLPSEWLVPLRELRCSYTLIEGRWVKLEKFSSMGNGFTFELETTLFAAICAAVLESNGVDPVHWENVFVFGDDIIVPSSLSSEVLAALKFFGFTPNQEKTFSSGSFRESCGGDYFLGADVRPHYIKDEVTEPQHLIVLANAMWRLRKKATAGHGLYLALHRAWLLILDQLPSKIRALRGPVELGDGLIHDDETRWRPRVRHSIRFFDCYLPVVPERVQWKNFDSDVVLATALYLSGSRPDSADDIGAFGVTSKMPVSGYRIKMVPFS